MKFVFFSVSENGENGLGNEGADGAMPPPPRIFGLEPPLDVRLFKFSAFWAMLFHS